MSLENMSEPEVFKISNEKLLETLEAEIVRLSNSYTNHNTRSAEDQASLDSLNCQVAG